MNILFAATEVAPLVKTGGLGDVAGALPAALRRLGHDARIVMPRYRRLRKGRLPQQGPVAASFVPAAERQEELRVFTATLQDVPLYLLDIPAAFERDSIYGDGDDDRRFILLCRGVLALMQHLREVESWQPDVLHGNDWHTGLLPNYLKTHYSYTFGHIASVYTIHNLAYQGRFSPFTLSLAGLSESGLVEERAGLVPHVNFMARGILHADMVNTVSPTYAQEIRTPEYGEHLDGLLRLRQDHLTGILNGIDYETFDPARDPDIPAHYRTGDMAGKAVCKAALQRECGLLADPQRPLLGMVTRLVEQKGLDLVEQSMDFLIDKTDAQLVILGTGLPHLEQSFAWHGRRHPDRISVQLRFDHALAQRIYAGCDAFLMPSRYEPCGLGQLIALRYGAVPIVRATGGLADTVREGYDGNGFRFHPYEARYLQEAIARCLHSFRDPVGWPILRERGMSEDHSWDASAREYVGLYEGALRQVGRSG